MRSRTHKLWAAAALSLLLIPADAAARSNFVGKLPNVSACGQCHINPGGGNGWNAFGLDVRANLTNGSPDWSKVFDKDSDGDGYTNGVELGDPDGDGTKDADWTPTNPAKSSSTPCGNGSIEAGVEVCDGDDLAGQTCEDQGAEAGTLKCAADCKSFDTSACGGGGEVDMGSGDVDMGTGSTDMGTGSTDMGTGSTDMGAGSTDMGTSNPPTTSTDDDEGCAVASPGTAPAGGMGLLGLLGLAGFVGWRRRR